jgi:hypothetical protein
MAGLAPFEEKLMTDHCRGNIIATQAAEFSNQAQKGMHDVVLKGARKVCRIPPKRFVQLLLERQQ